MTSAERVFAVLQGRTPDRVPVMEMFIDPKVIDSICSGMSYEDFIDYADMDVVTCLTMVEDSDRMNWIDKEKGIWKDKWGALQKITEELLSVVIEPACIETDADLDAYHIPDPLISPVIDEAKELVRRFKNKRAIAVIGEASFAPSQYLRAGLANLMIDYATRPEFVKKLAKIGMDYHVELYRKLISEGVEIVVLGDDYAGKTGTYMSPSHFEEYILPCLKTIVKVVKEAGGYCIHHNDGDIWSIMDMLISTGLDMLGPLEPAYMKLDKVRIYSKGRIGVLGNIDVDLLCRSTVEEVRVATKELIARVSSLGGHIFSSGNTISSGVKGENFMAMLETVKEYGKYPITI